MSLDDPQFAPIIVGLLLVVLSLPVLAATSYASGWHRLSKRFRASPLPNIETLNMQSGRMGWISFKNSLSLYSSKEGLYLRPLVLFRFQHPPLLIPWSEIKVHKADTWFGQLVDLTLGSDEQVRLRITAYLWHILKQDRHRESIESV